MEKLFDNLKKGMSIAKDEAGKFTKVVMDKTTNMVDLTKLNLAKNDTEGKINKVYAKIGQVIYNEYLNGNEFDGEIGDSCIELDKFNAEIADIKEQISNLKNTVECAACGQYNDKSGEYCTKCGAKLSEEAKATEDVIVDIVTEDE